MPVTNKGMSEVRGRVENAASEFSRKHDVALRDAIQILLTEVRATLPPSERDKVVATATGIKGEVRFGLTPGYLRAGLSKAFINYRDQMARVTGEI